MDAPVITDRVGSLVDAMVDQVFDSLGRPGPVMLDGVRHVLRLQLAKVVAEYLTRAATR